MDDPTASPAQPPRRRRLWRRLAWLSVLALPLVGYAYLTQPSRLRALVLSELRDRLPGRVRLGEVSYAPWRGLMIADLNWSDAHATDAEPRLSVRAADVRVRCDWGALGRGRVEIAAVTVAELDVALVADAPCARIAASPATKSVARALPVLSVTRGRLRLLESGGDRRRLLEQWRFVLCGRRGGAGRQYACTVSAPPDRGGRELFGLVLSDDGGFEAGADWLPLRTLRAVFGGRSAQVDRALAALEPWSPVGEARIAALRGRGGAVDEARIELRQLSATAPVDATVTDDGATVLAPPDERFLRLSDGAGSVAWVDGVLHADLQGAVRGGQWRAELSAHAPDAPVAVAAADPNAWSAELHLSVTNLPLPTHAGQRAFVDSPLLPNPIRAFFDDYAPTGRLDLTVTAKRTAGAADWDIRATGAARDGTCCYHHFPYPVTHARGRFTFENGRLQLDHLEGRRGSAHIVGRGVVDEPEQWTGFKLTLSATNLPLDEDLYAALPPDYRRLWDDATPIGVCDVTVHIARPPGTRASGPLEPQTRVRAAMLAGSISVGERRVGSASGAFDVAEGVIRVTSLRGHLDGGVVQMSGQARLTERGIDEAWQASLADLQLTEVAPIAAGSAPNDPASAALTLDFSGAVDVWRQATRSAEGAEQEHNVVRVKRGTLASSSPNDPWTVRDGWLSAWGAVRTLRDLHCVSPAGVVRASGEFELRDDQVAPRRLDVQAQAPAADGDLARLLRQLAPPRWQETVRRFGVGGAGGLAVAVRSATDASEAISAEVRLDAERMRPVALPLDLRDARLALTVGGREFRFLEPAKARYAEGGWVELDGRGDWSATGETWLSVRAHCLPLGPDFVNAMPPALAGLLNSIGHASYVSIDDLTVIGGPNADWQVCGGISVDADQFDIGLPLTDFVGTLSDADGRCEVLAEGGVRLDAAFTIERGRLAGRPLRDWRGRVRYAPTERWIEIDETTGRFCGGRILGEAQIDPTTGEYNVALTLARVGLDALFGRTDHDAPPPTAAALDGRIYVRGVGGDAGSRRGGGELRIRAAEAASAAVLESVVQASQGTRRRLPNNADLIEMQFDWVGAQLRLKRVVMLTGDASLVGRGRWNMQTDAIDLTLVAGPPDLPASPLRDLMDIAREELAQYRVTGTAAQPRVAIEPLHNIADALRDLLAPS